MDDTGDFNKRIKKSVEEAVKKIGKQTKANGLRVVNELRNAQMHVLSGQRSGKTYRIAHTKVSYTASKPGEAPARKSGDLRMHWQGNVRCEPSTGNKLMVIAELVSFHEYSLALETGTKHMAARPYKDAIVSKATPKIRQILK